MTKVARNKYPRMIKSNQGKYHMGTAKRPMALKAKGRNGKAVTNRQAQVVIMVTGRDAQLFKKGSLGVLSIWMTSVWLHMDSMNQPLWKMLM